MDLKVDDELQTFIALEVFRQAHGLPSSFGVAQFQPKSYVGLGSLERAGEALNQVREQMITALPAEQNAAGWLAVIPEIAAQFEAALWSINEQVGLREPEIAFAVGGLGDMLSAWAFALARSQFTQAAPPGFDAVYRAWLYDSVAVGGTAYSYPHPHNEQTWTITVISHVYGRIGLRVQTPTATHYVVDKSLACPAEGYMYHLLEALCKRIASATI